MTNPTTARVIEAIACLNAHGFADVSPLLAKYELQERLMAQRHGKRKVAVGKVKGKAGEFYIDASRLRDAVADDGD